MVGRVRLAVLSTPVVRAPPEVAGVDRASANAGDPSLCSTPTSGKKEEEREVGVDQGVGPSAPPVGGWALTESAPGG